MGTNINFDYVDDKNHLGDDLNSGVDIISVAFEPFTSAIIDFDSAHCNMVHYSKDHAIIYDHFNKIVSLLLR
jgi:hypothetical protein